MKTGTCCTRNRRYESSESEPKQYSYGLINRWTDEQWAERPNTRSKPITASTGKRTKVTDQGWVDDWRKIQWPFTFDTRSSPPYTTTYVWNLGHMMTSEQSPQQQHLLRHRPQLKDTASDNRLNYGNLSTMLELSLDQYHNCDTALFQAKVYSFSFTSSCCHDCTRSARTFVMHL